MYGIAIASGKTWAEQRRFFSQYLASSKSKFDDVIGEEAKSMCQEVSENTGFSSEIGTKLRDWAVGQAGGSCYSRAALSSNDSKTLYNELWLLYRT